MAITTHTKTTPIGVDVPIKKCQTQLGDKLSWDTADIYGRVYLNTDKGNNIIAEAHKSSGEYKEIFIDDSLDGVIGFIVSADRDSNVVQVVDIELICSVKLDRIYPNAVTRNDEEALQEVVRILEGVGGWTIEKITAGNIREVYHFMNTKKIVFRDTQPYANFSIRCSVNFKNNICEIL